MFDYPSFKRDCRVWNLAAALKNDRKVNRLLTVGMVIIVAFVQYIDDGRLRMKPNCVVLTDVALRTKALDVLFSYNPAWLRLGLAVVLGPIAFSDKNLSTPEGFVDEENHPETTFLEVLLEEHFFGDSTLAKQFATNRYILAFYLRHNPEFNEFVESFLKHVRKILCHLKFFDAGL